MHKEFENTTQHTTLTRSTNQNEPTSFWKILFNLLYYLILRIDSWSWKRNLIVATAGFGTGLGLAFGALQNPIIATASLSLPVVQTPLKSQLIIAFSIIEKDLFFSTNHSENIQFVDGGKFVLINNHNKSSDLIPELLVGTKIRVHRANNSWQDYIITNIIVAHKKQLIPKIQNSDGSFIFAYKTGRLSQEYIVLVAK